MTLPKGAEERFRRIGWEVKPSGCWEWKGSRHVVGGYGQMRGTDQSGPLKTHRVAYELAHGPIPEGMFICHRCDNPLCVNPAHLRAVTQKQNNENYSGPHSRNASRVRGVIWRKTDRRWSVQVHHNRKNHYGGVFSNIADAEQAAIALQLKLYTHNDVDRGITQQLVGGNNK